MIHWLSFGKSRFRSQDLERSGGSWSRTHVLRTTSRVCADKSNEGDLRMEENASLSMAGLEVARVKRRERTRSDCASGDIISLELLRKTTLGRETFK